NRLRLGSPSNSPSNASFAPNSFTDQESSTHDQPSALESDMYSTTLPSGEKDEKLSALQSPHVVESSLSSPSTGETYHLPAQPSPKVIGVAIAKFSYAA